MTSKEGQQINEYYIIYLKQLRNEEKQHDIKNIFGQSKNIYFHLRI